MNLLKMLSASECLLLCLAVLILSASAEGEPGSRIKVVVREGSDAILPCSLSTKENIEQKLFHWRKVDRNEQEVFRYNGGLHYYNGLPGQDEHFRGRVSHFPLELQSGNASIIIRNTVVPDSGTYTCDLYLQPKQKFTIELVVGTCGQVITGWLAGCLIGMLIVASVLAVLVATKTISIHTYRGCPGSANKSSDDPPAPDSETGPEELKSLNKVVCSPATSHCSLANGNRNTDS